MRLWEGCQSYILATVCDLLKRLNSLGLSVEALKRQLAQSGLRCRFSVSRRNLAPTDVTSMAPPLCETEEKNGGGSNL